MTQPTPMPAPMPVANAEIEDAPPPVAQNTTPPMTNAQPGEEVVVATNVTPAPPTTNPTSPTPPAEQPPTPIPGVARDTRLPIPEDGAQAVSKRLLAELYKPQYDRAKTPDQKRELARVFLAKANEISGDVAGHYLLVKLARDLAIQSGDVGQTLQATNILATTYQINGHEEKLDALDTLAKALRSQADADLFLGECRALLMAAVRQDDYELATKAIVLSETVAKRGKMNQQLDQLSQTRKTLDELKQAYASVPPALSAIEQEPTNTEANAIVGRYRCFYRRDWHSGLPNLARGSDVKLRVIAQIDASNPTSAAQQSDLGDQWFELADTIAKPWAKNSVLLRAAYWYQQAFHGLPNGLIKSRVQKRLGDIATTTGDEGVKAFVDGTKNALPTE